MAAAKSLTNTLELLYTLPHVTPPPPLLSLLSSRARYFSLLYLHPDKYQAEDSLAAPNIGPSPPVLCRRNKVPCEEKKKKSKKHEVTMICIAPNSRLSGKTRVRTWCEHVENICPEVTKTGKHSWRPPTHTVPCMHHLPPSTEKKYAYNVLSDRPRYDTVMG